MAKDYTTTDVFRSGRRYHLVLDTIGNLSVRDLRRALAEGGKAAVVGFTSLTKLISVSLRGGKDIAQVSAHVTTTDLEYLSNLIEAGKVRPQIDRRYPFAEIPAAITYLEQGHARGKVVVGAPWRFAIGPPSDPQPLRLVDIDIPSQGLVRRSLPGIM
jgi:NADPH:quinone reductase-like Zn-dependent oxidoreductase